MLLKNTMMVTVDNDMRDFGDDVNEANDDDDEEGGQYKQLIAVKGGVRQNVPLQPFERLEQLSSEQLSRFEFYICFCPQ